MFLRFVRVRRVATAGRVALVTSAAWAQPAAPKAAAPSTSVRSVATVMQIMHAMVIPASDAVFKAAGEPPKDDAAWTALLNSAVTLTESGNLLLIGNRPAGRAEWMRMARAMVDAGAGAMKAVEGKNAEALSTASDQIYETCEACHAKYLKKSPLR